MKRTLQGKAYDWISNEIAAGRIKPLAPLREKAIADKIGSSVTPVREALRRLQNEGWVDNTPFSGFYLKEFNKEHLREKILFRQTIEITCIEELIITQTSKKIKDLENILLKSESEIELIAKQPNQEPTPEQLQSCKEVDLEFHRKIVELSGLTLMAEQYSNLNIQVQVLARYSFEKHDKIDLRGYALLCHQHRAILTAIRFRWKNAAVELLKGHINQEGNDVKVY